MKISLRAKQYKAEIISTNLSNEHEDQLRKAFAE